MQTSNFPVQAAWSPDGIESTGISYDDYRGMQLKRGNVNVTRRLPTPEWAINNALLVKVLVRYMEMRSQINRGRKRQRGTPQQRIERAQAKLIQQKPLYIAGLDRIAKRYVEQKNAGASEQELKKLRIEIEALDTHIRLADDAVKIPLGVVYHYYRRQRDSVEVAAELGLKPPHVRQICWRLHKAAKQALDYQGPRWRINLLCPVRFPKAPKASKEKHYVCAVCGAPFSKPDAHKKYCGVVCKKKSKAARKKVRCARKPPLQFCSDACRDVSKIASKLPAPVPEMTGQGVWRPAEAGVGYENYKKFCEVIGVEPLKEAAWRADK